MKTTSSAYTKVGLALVVLGIFCFTFVYLRHAYLSLTAAAVVGYLLEPLVVWLQKKGISREWGALIAVVCFFLVIGITGVAVIPRLVDQVRELIEKIPLFYSKIAEVLGPISERHLGYNIFRDTNAFFSQFGAGSELTRPLGNILENVFSTGIHVITGVFSLVIIPIMCYYLMKDFPAFYRTFLSLVPRRHHKTVAELRERLDRVFGGFIRGQLGVSSVLAIYYSVGLTVIGMHLSLVLGLIAGYSTVIPYLGILTSLSLTLLIALVNGATLAKFIGVGIVFGVGMAMESGVLTPRIVGKRVGLRPLTLILALLIGGELQGVVGMLMAVPFAAVGKVFVGFILDSYRTSESFNRM